MTKLRYKKIRLRPLSKEDDHIMKIRRNVLNMSWKMWKKLGDVYGTEDEIKTTPEEFLNKVGLPGGSSIYYNEEETRFFEEIYKMAR
jgi:hypothetical protein